MLYFRLCLPNLFSTLSIFQSYFISFFHSAFPLYEDLNTVVNAHPFHHISPFHVAFSPHACLSIKFYTKFRLIFVFMICPLALVLTVLVLLLCVLHKVSQPLLYISTSFWSFIQCLVTHFKVFLSLLSYTPHAQCCLFLFILLFIPFILSILTNPFSVHFLSPSSM